MSKAAQSTSSSSSANNTGGGDSSSSINPDLRWYTFDEDKLADLRRRSPWKDDAKYFKKVAVSPSAIVKMVCVHDSIFVGCDEVI